MARKRSSSRKGKKRPKPAARRKTAAPRKRARGSKTAAKRRTRTVRRKAPRTRATATSKRRRRLTEGELQGPPPREATILRTDREREAATRIAEQRATSPKLTGGDVDADWPRAASVGEEAVGGSVATPDQSVVDDLGEALGVPRSPDAPVRSSEEILKERDARRHRRGD